MFLSWGCVRLISTNKKNLIVDFCSSPLSTPGCVQFVFNVLHFGAEEGRSEDRDGVCTGWINNITRHLQNSHQMKSVSHETENQSRPVEECPKVMPFCILVGPGVDLHTEYFHKLGNRFLGCKDACIGK